MRANDRQRKCKERFLRSSVLLLEPLHHALRPNTNESRPTALLPRPVTPSCSTEGLRALPTLPAAHPPAPHRRWWHLRCWYNRHNTSSSSVLFCCRLMVSLCFCFFFFCCVARGHPPPPPGGSSGPGILLLGRDLRTISGYPLVLGGGVLGRDSVEHPRQCPCQLTNGPLPSHRAPLPEPCHSEQCSVPVVLVTRRQRPPHRSTERCWGLPCQCVWGWVWSWCVGWGARGRLSPKTP